MATTTIAASAAGLDDDEPNNVWGPAAKDALDELAFKFKQAGDNIGLYLCVLADECFKECERNGDACHTLPFLFSQIALVRMSDVDALHGLGHMLQPQVAELFARARMKAKIDEMLASTTQ